MCSNLTVVTLRIRFLTQIAINCVFTFESVYRQPYQVGKHTLAGEVTDTTVVLCILIPRATKYATVFLFTALCPWAWRSWATVCIINTPWVHNITNKTYKHTRRRIPFYQCIRWKQCPTFISFKLRLHLHTCGTSQSYDNLYFPCTGGGEREPKAQLVVKDKDQL